MRWNESFPATPEPLFFCLAGGVMVMKELQGWEGIEFSISNQVGDLLHM